MEDAAAAAAREARRKKAAENQKKFGVGGGAVEKFCAMYSLEEMLSLCGYTRRSANSDHWRSPFQTSSSHATRIFSDETEGSARQEFFISLSELRPRGADRKTFRRRWCVWRCL